ncbi:nucleoside-diphosphate kinase [Nonomuraea sp. NPDC049695]|uniref:nucleoside-diphosphate kinase n=1 Tax=Nonomuraea sp. NPDC049695 TaxID=3154734 RepID=UPI0034325055
MPACWDRHVFCLIGPDAVRRHLVGPILERFATAGLRPDGWRCLQLTSHQIDTMHELAMVRSSQAYRFRCLDLLFALGPSILLRLADVRPDLGDIYARATAAKGASDPKDAAPGTIRHDLRAINVVMSLLHTSDSPADAARESDLLLTGDDAHHVWNDPRELPDLIAVTSRRRVENRLFGDVLADIRTRVLLALWPQLGSAARSEAGRLAAMGHLGDPATGRKLASMIHPTASPLLDVLEADFDRPIDLRSVRGTLTGSGIDLDDWETAVLGTSMYFPPAW